MKTLSEMIEESYQYGGSQNRRVSMSKSEELQLSKSSSFHNRYVNRNWTFIPTVHASARAYTRIPEFEAEDWFKMHRSVVDKFDSLSSPIRDGVYVFYSKSMNQAYVAAVDAGARRVKIITVLPRGKSSPKGGNQKTKTVRMIIEGVVVEDILYID